MIEQQGRVLRTDGHQALVRLGGTSGCQACDNGRGCGAGLFGRLLNRRPIDLPLENTLGARPGQAVRVGVEESLLLKLSLRLYLLPLAALLLGAVSGHLVAVVLGFDGLKADAMTLTVGIIAMALLLRAPVRKHTELSGVGDVHMLRIVNLDKHNLIERTLCE
jgi:sigma-E factor negative regulatory protein RseC